MHKVQQVQMVQMVIMEHKEQPVLQVIQVIQVIQVVQVVLDHKVQVVQILSLIQLVIGQLLVIMWGEMHILQLKDLLLVGTQVMVPKKPPYFLEEFPLLVIKN